MIKKKNLLETIQVDTEDRTEFTLFEASVLAARKQWDEYEYTITDPHFKETQYNNGSKTKFIFEFQDKEDFFNTIGIEYTYAVQTIAADIEEAEYSDSNYYRANNDFYYTDNADEDWDNGIIIENLDDDSYTLLMELFKLRNFNSYQKIKSQSKEKQVEVLVSFFDRKKNKYDKELIEHLMWEYADAMDEAYRTGYFEWVKGESDVLTKYDIETYDIFEKYYISARAAIQLIYRFNLPRTATFANIVKAIYDASNFDWDNDERFSQNRLNMFDNDVFNESSWFKNSKKEIEEWIEKFKDKEEEEVKKIYEMEAGMEELEKFGVTFGEWHENNVTPDKKFKFQLTDYDFDSHQFHVRLWDANMKKSIAGYMTLDGVKKLATMPSLFSAVEMLSESVDDSQFNLPDKMRLMFLEGATLSKSEKKEPLLKELFQQPVARKLQGGRIEYNEVWTQDDLKALRSQPDYKTLTLRECFDKFIQERFQKAAMMLGLQIEDYDIQGYANDDIEYDYWMKIYLT